MNVEKLSATRIATATPITDAWTTAGDDSPEVIRWPDPSPRHDWWVRIMGLAFAE